MSSSASLPFGPDFVSGLAPACAFLASLVWPTRGSTPDWRATMALQAGGMVGTPTISDVPGYHSNPERFTTESRALWKATSFPREIAAQASPVAFLRPGDRYASLATVPVGAYLAIGRYRLPPSGDDPLPEAEAYSQPVLTVINLPCVTPRGQALEAATIWPGDSETFRLLPGQLPRPDNQFFPVAGSVMDASRDPNRVTFDQSAYCSDGATVWVLDGCHMLAHVLIPSTVFSEPPTEAGAYSDGPFWGPRAELQSRGGTAFVEPSGPAPGDSTPLIWCGLPRVLLLPPCHDLPVGLHTTTNNQS